MARLWELFKTHLESDASAEAARAANAALERLWAAATAAWPGTTVAPAAFVARMADVGAEALPSVSEQRAEAAYIAAAVADRAPGAEESFDRRYLARIPAMLAHMKLADDLVDEVTQQVRIKLLVKDDAGVSKLETYAARGKLDGLVQVVATRAALDMVRKQRRAPEHRDDLDVLPDPTRDPELQFLKTKYRAEFARAFASAATSLEPRHRNLLRLHLLDGVTLEKLAAMYDVHRATVVRWLAKAREELLAGTRARLKSQLTVDSAALDDVMELIQSRLDVSVRRHLRSTNQ